MSREFDPDEPPPPVPNLKASVTDPFGYRGTLATSGVDRDIEAGMGTNTDHAADRISSGIGTDSSIKIQRTFDATSWALTRAASDDIMYRPQQHRWKQRQNSIGGTTPSSMIRIASQRVAAALPRLFSRVVSARGAATGVNEEFYCEICLSNNPKGADSYELPCSHIYCRDCLAGYLSVKIKDAQVSVFKCPHIDASQMGNAEGWACAVCTFFNSGPVPNGADARVTCSICDTDQDAPPRADPGCPYTLEESDLKALLDEETLQRLTRFREMKENKHYRECPKCGESNTDGPTFFSNTLTCGVCSYKYCYLHSDAHPGKSCREFEREHRADERLAAAHIAQFTRPCPGCKQPIEKSSGCNHMTCPTCDTNFCWLCGRKIGGGTYPSHYAPWNVMGCPNMQMDNDAREGLTNTQASARSCVWRVAYIPMALSVFAIGSFAFSLFLGLSIAWMSVVGVICWCLFLPLYQLIYFCISRWQEKDCDIPCGFSSEDILPLCLYAPFLPFLSCMYAFQSD